jgi:integrase
MYRPLAKQAVRRALDRVDFCWVTSHSFRKTTAAILDQAGLSARVIADQLGHARPSMTQDVYMGCKLMDGRAVEVLECLWPSRTQRNTEPLEGKGVGD